MSNEILDLVKARVNTSGKKIIVTQTPNEIDCGEFSKLHAEGGFENFSRKCLDLISRSLVLPAEIIIENYKEISIEPYERPVRKFVESKVI